MNAKLSELATEAGVNILGYLSAFIVIGGAIVFVVWFVGYLREHGGDGNG